MFVGYLFLRFKDGHEIRQINPSQTLRNLQYMPLKICSVYSYFEQCISFIGASLQNWKQNLSGIFILYPNKVDGRKEGKLGLGCHVTALSITIHRSLY